MKVIPKGDIGSKSHPFWLTFLDPELELRFREQYILQALGVARIGLIAIASIVFGLWGLDVDRVVGADYMK